MKNCIFCKILNKELEASFVYQNDRVSAFMDINPINRGHVLIIPNDHHERFSGVEQEDVAEMFKVGQLCLKAIEKSDISCEGANIFLSDGEIAGQEVPHSHLHVAPRFKSDGHRMGFSGTDPNKSSRDKLNDVASIIKNQLKEDS